VSFDRHEPTQISDVAVVSYTIFCTTVDSDEIRLRFLIPYRQCGSKEVKRSTAAARDDFSSG
jgi:hypothetical protein